MNVFVGWWLLVFECVGRWVVVGRKFRMCR